MVSCDRPHPGQKDMWEVLHHTANSLPTHLVLHMGDNVYLDEKVFSKHTNKEIVRDDDIAFDAEKVDQTTPYIAARRVLRGVEPADWDSKRDDILEIYRAKYRENWSRPSKAKVLANFSNLMILDDHDIRDDFGSLAEDSEPGSREYFLGSLAVQVYHEYQRRLWDPDVLGRAADLRSEYYRVDLGPLRVIMTDSRLSRALYRPRRQPGDNTYFGRDQMDSLITDLTCCPPRTRMHIVVTTMPMFGLSKVFNKLAVATNVNDDAGAFISTAHAGDIAVVMDAVRERQRQTGGAGDVLLAAGDLHLAGFTDIYYGKGRELVCRQIVSSAIANKHVTRYAYAGLRALLHFTDTYGEYRYAHYDWQSTCNFGHVLLDSKDPGRLAYSVRLVHENGTELRQSANPDWDHGHKTTSCTCRLL